MNFLLTGATGFIGSHVAETLLRNGHDVQVLIRPGADTWRIRDLLPELRVIHGDVLDPPSGLQAECCIHLAWDVQPGKYLTSPQNTDYLCASLRLAKILAANGCGRFVGVGTGAEYALHGASPLRETDPTDPQSLYATCKLSLCNILEKFCAATRMEFAWARLFYHYGPKEDPRRLVPLIIHALKAGQCARLTPGEQIRDFLHVADTAGGLVSLSESDLTGVVNIGSNRPVSVLTIAQTIGTLLKRPDLIVPGAFPYPPGEPMHVVADNTRLLQTGWVERHDLTSGLQHTLEWWAKQQS